MIFKSAKDFARHDRGDFACTSGGFDPLHRGHVESIAEAATIAEFLVVIVNGDGFLMRKKGFVFQDLAERMRIIDAMKGVYAVIPWDDGSQTVCGALEIVRPKIFAKGGDRIAGNVPEEEICKKIGCRIVYGVGGGKIQSSQKLTEKAAKQYAALSRKLSNPEPRGSESGS